MTASDNSIEAFRFVKGEMLQKCAHTLKPLLHQLPKDATGGVLSQNYQAESGDDFMIVVCGGQETMEDCSSCFSLGNPYSRVFGSLFVPRVNAASLIIDNGKSLWVTGGKDEVSPLTSSEYIQLQQDSGLVSFSERQALPYSRQGHCLAKIGATIAILTGGLGHNSNFSLDFKTWTVNISMMEWREKPRLNIGRSGHVCSVLRDLSLPDMVIAIVAGGRITENNFALTDSVEMLTAENEEQFHTSMQMIWEFGPSLPKETSDSASATTANQEKMFVIGGIDKDGDVGSTFIYGLQCASLQCQWTKLDLELSAPSSNGLAFMLPTIPMADRLQTGHQCEVYNETRGKKIINCLCYSCMDMLIFRE